jgi:hypothetical protein
MTKPDLSTIRDIIPNFNYWVQTALPAIYDDSLSFYETLSKVISHLNEIGLLTNDTVTKWNEVSAWVLGEGLTEGIDIKMDELMSNGEIESLLNGKMFTQLNLETQEALAKAENPLSTMQANGVLIGLDMLSQAVKDAMSGTTGITTAKGPFENNRGVEYPLINMTRVETDNTSVVHPFDTQVKDTILSAKVTGAKKGKYYGIMYISNGFGGVYGVKLCEYTRNVNDSIQFVTRRTLLDYTVDNQPAPTSSIVTRTIEIPAEKITFEITYDNSKIAAGSGLDICNTTAGKAKGSVIHPENYVYMENVLESDLIGKVVVNKTLPTRFYVYRKTGNGNYVGIELNKSTKAIVPDASSNYDGWFVRTIKEYSRSGTVFTPVRSIIDEATPTTMDLMIKENTAGYDYMGGINHGDEVNQVVKLLIDGKEIPIDSTGYWEGAEVRLLQVNALYRDSVAMGGVLQQLATVGKEHVFNTKDGYKLNVTVKWLYNVELDETFLGALSLYRPTWKYVYTDMDLNPYDLTVVGGQSPSTEDVNRVVVQGDKVMVEFSIDRYKNIPGNKTWVANFSDVNSKIYPNYTPKGYQAKAGEIFKQSTKYYFDFYA